MKRINLSLFNNILNMCKVLHWSTHSYSKHMALDQAYDAFKDFFDEYVECALGIYGRESAITTTINNKIVPEDIMISFVEDEFVNFNNEVAKITGEFTQLQSIFDDIKAAESQLVYRLRMGA